MYPIQEGDSTVNHRSRKLRRGALVSALAVVLGAWYHLGATPLDEELQILAGDVCERLNRAEIERLGVLDFTMITGGKNTTTAYLTEQFTTAIVEEETRAFQVVDRSRISTVLAELESQNRQREEGLLDPDTLVEFGRLSGVDAVAVGTVTALRSVVEINVKVLDVATGVIHASLKRRVNTPQLGVSGAGGQTRMEVPLQDLVQPPPARSEETREEKKRRKQAEKEAKRRQKAQKRAAMALADAAIAGCAPGSVKINLRGVGNASSALLVTKSAAKVRVINLHTSPIDISDESGVLVQNLCSGGSITLSRGYASFAFSSSNQRIQYRYTATGRFPDGALGTDQSRTISLSANQNGLQSLTWEVRLRKVR